MKEEISKEAESLMSEAKVQLSTNGAAREIALQIAEVWRANEVTVIVAIKSLEYAKQELGNLSIK
ncbi:hypothetical protein SPD48_09690 [Pseudogracilibacillus sp. SE30717A]|uniref:hypothetical protein n=1 Tax=Pseudogracilibacillus sp. SE30717A TaxID=3098293 RepID=UPI00300E1DE7